MGAIGKTKRDKLAETSVVLSVGVVMAIAFAVIMQFCFAKADQTDPNERAARESTVKAGAEPIIIWHHNVIRDTPESLKTALSSGLINYVSTGVSLNRRDFDYRTGRSVTPKAQSSKVREVVAILKESGVKIIWDRNFWPLYNIEGVQASDFFNPNYYIEEIRHIKAEAKEIGADYASITMEPHGYAPMLPYMKHPGDTSLTDEQLEHLRCVVRKAVETAGKVDFIGPGGSMFRRHPYNILSQIGKNKVSRNTFWFNIERIESIDYDYDIFGAYLNTVKFEDWSGEHRPFFFASEIFENSHLWSDKKGVFLYPREHKALEVAKELVAYARSLPYKKAIEQKEPNASKER